jgi:hypothetical protein
MRQGNSGPNDQLESSSDAQGLNLSVSAEGSPAANGVHLVLGQGVLPLKTRLLMQVEFDRPNAVPPPQPNTGTPEPWAVALNVKFGNENFVANEPMVPVTCQFNRRLNGVRLNTPGHEEGDQATILVSPLNYTPHPPPVFLLEHYFCGFRAAGRYSIGHGSLTIKPPATTKDQRVYSNKALSGGQQTWIGALGVTLVTLDGFGKIMVRL